MVVGAIGALLGGGGSGSSDDDGGTGAPVAAASVSSTTVRTLTTTTTTVAPGEDAATFLGLLAAAIRAGDEVFLFDRLHPEVLARYGAEVCRAHVAKFVDTTSTFTVRSVSAPGAYSWETDGRSTQVAGTLTVAVERTSAGERSEAEVHVTPVDGTVRWFTDCGEPIG